MPGIVSWRERAGVDRTSDRMGCQGTLDGNDPPAVWYDRPAWSEMTRICTRLAVSGTWILRRRPMYPTRWCKECFARRFRAVPSRERV